MKKISKKYLITPFIVLLFIIGGSLSFFFYKLTSNAIQNSTTLEFKYLLKRKSESIQRELDVNILVLESLQSYYKSSKNIERDEFKMFVDTHLKNSNSIQAISWVPKVIDKDKDSYLIKTRKELGKEFIIKEKSSSGKMVEVKNKNEYFPVDYIEPIIGNKKAQGFDLSSNETRLKTLNEAKNNNKITATASIKLVQEEGTQFGFLVIAPVWDIKKSNILKGYYSAVFRIGDMITTALEFNKLDSSMIDLWLVDTTNKQKEELLFTNTQIKRKKNIGTSLDINIEGRNWTLYAKPSILFLEKQKSYLPLFLLILSLSITILTIYIVALKSMKANELEGVVKEKTKTILASNKKLESLLFMFDQKVIAVSFNKEGLVSYVTKAYENISGYTKEEILQNQDLYMSKNFSSKIWKNMVSRGIFTDEIKCKKKDGTSYWTNISIFPEYDEKKQIVGYFDIREDITAKKEVESFNDTLSLKIEEAIYQNQKKDKLLIEQSKLAAMGEMLGAIAHQWRQPLNTLGLHLQFIEDDYEDNLVDKKYVTKFTEESMQLVSFMSNTIDDFRNFFLIDKVKTSFDIRTKIDETLNILKVQMEKYNILLVIEGESFNIMGHAGEFQQVILNIFNNAKDAMLSNNIENRKISVELKLVEEIGYIKISDNAGGISEENIDRIFEPYFTTKEQGKGIGLGLYMSKMIIEDNMQGKIKIENSDNGAIFTIELEVSSN